MAYTYGQIRQLAVNAGFTGKSADTISAIALAESGGNPGAINYGDPGGSYGLTQINEKAHPGQGLSALDPQTSLNLAYDISGGGTNFRPWSTYTSGAYQKYLQTGSDSGVDVAGGSSSLTTAPGYNFNPGSSTTAGYGGAVSTSPGYNTAGSVAPISTPTSTTGGYAGYGTQGSVTNAYGGSSYGGSGVTNSSGGGMMLAGLSGLSGAFGSGGGALSGGSGAGSSTLDWIKQVTGDFALRAGVFILAALAIGAAAWALARGEGRA